MKKIEILELTEFSKDFKQLLKKYRSLDKNLEEVKNLLMLFPDENPPFSFRINGLGIETCIIKVKKITSNNFKGRGSNSGFRLVYAWFPDNHLITLIELYHKSEKALEDRDRILRNFSD
jgi:mRNA-degrading endonuclease RelE of RelBE toxin-antitoxin system